MIGNPKWFKRRKYTGWGFTPKTWQGWIYILALIVPVILVTKLNILAGVQIIFLIIWAIIFIIDFIHISINLEKDERERIHEAISERNALWAILTVLVVGIAYQSASTAAMGGVPHVDPIILIAIVTGLMIKIISNIYLDRKN